MNDRTRKQFPATEALISTAPKNVMELELPSFAKINLRLLVTGLRRDGYHTLDTIFQALELHDTLTFRFRRSSEFQVTLDVGKSKIPTDSGNLISQACSAFHEVYPLKHSIHVTVRKRIPSESGLGGGSSNAGCTLIALSKLYDWPIPRVGLLRIARRLGADVPFFLYGGTAHGTRRGDLIRQVPDWPPKQVLLVHPKIRCSTPEIYRKFDEMDLLTRRRDFNKILSDQKPESRREFVSLIENDLEKVVVSLYPEIGSIKKRLLTLGATATAVTGSGSVVFGLFEDQLELAAAAKQIPGSIRTRFVDRKEYRKRIGF